MMENKAEEEEKQQGALLDQIFMEGLLRRRYLS